MQGKILGLFSFSLPCVHHGCCALRCYCSCTHGWSCTDETTSIDLLLLVHGGEAGPRCSLWMVHGLGIDAGCPLWVGWALIHFRRSWR